MDMTRTNGTETNDEIIAININRDNTVGNVCQSLDGIYRKTTFSHGLIGGPKRSCLKCGFTASLTHFNRYEGLLGITQQCGSCVIPVYMKSLKKYFVDYKGTIKNYRDYYYTCCCCKKFKEFDAINIINKEYHIIISIYSEREFSRFVCNDCIDVFKDGEMTNVGLFLYDNITEDKEIRNYFGINLQITDTD